jgi:hypothetical protein
MSGLPKLAKAAEAIRHTDGIDIFADTVKRVARTTPPPSYKSFSSQPLPPPLSFPPPPLLSHQGDMRVPVAVDWDSRHLVALLEFARVVSDYMQQHDIPLTLLHTNTHNTSSSSSSTTEGPVVPLLPPVSLALVLANLIIFFKPGGVLLRTVSLSPYCVVDRKEYRRWGLGWFWHGLGGRYTAGGV